MIARLQLTQALGNDRADDDDLEDHLRIGAPFDPNVDNTPSCWQKEAFNLRHRYPKEQIPLPLPTIWDLTASTRPLTDSRKAPDAQTAKERHQIRKEAQKARAQKGGTTKAHQAHLHSHLYIRDHNKSAEMLALFKKVNEHPTGLVLPSTLHGTSGSMAARAA